MSIQCPRCDQQIDGVPDDCRDLDCPRAEIEDAIEAQFHTPSSPAGRLRAALQACHWSVRHVAPLIQWDERSIRHWLSGRYEPPADVLAWVERLAAVHSANPPPERIRRSE